MTKANQKNIKTIPPSAIVRVTTGMENNHVKVAEKANTQVTEAHTTVISVGKAVSELYAETPFGQKNAFPIDNLSNRVVSGQNDVLKGCLKIFTPNPIVPLTTEEKDIYEKLKNYRAAILPTGTGFLRGPYREQWSETESLLKRAQKAEAMVPSNFINMSLIEQRIKRCNNTYGQVLGISTEKETEKLAEEVKKWHEAMNWLMTSVDFLHRDEPEILDLVFEPYFKELEELKLLRERKLKQAKEDKEAKKSDPNWTF